jgi:hypothetical protein
MMLAVRFLRTCGEKRRGSLSLATAIRVIKSASEIGLRLTVRDDAITVTLPGTWFTVTYRRLPGLVDLVATNVVDDRRVALRKPDFLARASRIAHHKARELGWIS